jgi:radical SAM protein with 4Fe4S-binding SPASM domain
MPWAQPVIARQQMQLFPTLLEDLLPPEDPMRQFDALLNELDWSQWEAAYAQRAGQPPLHPRLVAGVILFGLLRGLRSSRQLEQASSRWIDLIWFLEGRRIDHSTFCNFRQRFASLLPDLFEQVARRAMAGVAGAGRTKALDGTSIRASSDRRGARTAVQLRRDLEEVSRNRQALLAQMEQQDALEEAAQALEQGQPQAMRRQLDQLRAQQEKLSRALSVAEQRDCAKRAKDGQGARAVRVPVADPQASVLPNKDGGYGPNYTAVAAADVDSGVITHAGVVDGAEETAAFAGAIQSAQRISGQAPQAIVADSNFVSGPALEELNRAGVELYAPVEPPVDPVVLRQDLTQPIEPEVVKQLPLSGPKKARRLSHRAFVYSHSEDVYYCPQGRLLHPQGNHTRPTKSGPVRYRQYACANCEGCPLKSLCLGGCSQQRTLMRDEHQELREQLALRMNQPQAKELYAQRAPCIEGVFGYIKQAMGVRQFLHRGRRAVQAEWQWICTAYNAGKILRRMGRKDLAALPESARKAITTLIRRFRGATATDAMADPYALAA